MTTTRISTFTVEGPVLDLFISDCASCGIVFGIPEDLERRRRADRQAFYCPNGHNLVFGGKTDEQKLDEAKARETALRDQLSAAIRDAEHARVQLLRDPPAVRQRRLPLLQPVLRRGPPAHGDPAPRIRRRRGADRAPVQVRLRPVVQVVPGAPRPPGPAARRRLGPAQRRVVAPAPDRRLTVVTRPPHSRQANRAITTELVRVTLGGRGPARPELLAPIFDDRTQHAPRRARARKKR